MARRKTPAHPTWTTACPDWEDRVVNKRSLIPFDPLFPSEAAAGMAVLDQFRVVDAGATFGELSREWVRDFCASVFGALDPNSGRRLVREWMLLISKKNTKSTTAGLLMLAILVLNWRQAGEFGILAPTVEVANNAYKPAADAIRADEELQALFHVQDHIRTITHRVTKASLQVVAADSETVAGKKWIVTLVDELWLFGKRANASDMLREAVGGLVSRPEGCVLWLSTQSNEPPAGVFAEKLNYARAVRDGKIKDPQFCPVLYEFPKRMLDANEHRKPENFYITNPNMGASVDEATLLREFSKAEAVGESEVRGFLAKHLNVEIGLALGTDRWAGAAFWEHQARRRFDLDHLLDRCDVVEIGIDGGGLDDMLGLCVLGRDRDSAEWIAWFRAWIHPVALDRRKSESTIYRDLIADGDLILVEKVGDDVAQVVSIVVQADQSGSLDKIGCDRAGLDELLDALKLEIDEERIVGISQSWPLMAAIVTCERKLAGGTLIHGGTRLMNWCVANAKTVLKGNAVYIHKETSGKAKIDPLMALFDAAYLLARAPAPTSGNYLAFITERAAATSEASA